MAFKTFVDRRNSYWQVWDVRPDRIERRSMDRRAESPAAWQGVERRIGERRKLQQKRIVLESGLGSGWLVFECKSEKRRLTPIPMNWEDCNESELRLLLEKSKLVADIGNNSTSAA